MHLTNASGQTVSLLNEADNARSGGVAARASTAPSANKQWTARVIAGGPSTASSARPTLPSLHSLSSAASAAAALQDRSSREGGIIEEEQCRQAQAQAQVAAQVQAQAGSRAVGDIPSSSHSYHHQLHHHSAAHYSHSAHSASAHSATSTSTSTNISTNSTSTTTTSPSHSALKPARPSLNIDSRYFSSSSSSNSLPTTSSISANKGNNATISLPYHHTSQHQNQQQSSSAAAAQKQHHHHHHHRAASHSRNHSHSHRPLPPSRPRLTHNEAYSRKSSYSSQLSYASSSTTTDPYSSQSDLADSPVFSPGAQSSTTTTTPQLLRFDSGSTSTSSTSRGASTPSPMTPSFGFDPLEQSKNQNVVDNPYARAVAANAPYFTPGLVQPITPLQQQQLQQQNAMTQIQLQQPQLISPASTAPQYAFTSGLTPLALDDAPAFLPPTQVPSFAYPGLTADLIPPSPVTNITSSASPQNPHATPSDPSSSSNAPPSQQKAKKKYPCPHAARFGCSDTFTTSGHAARHGKKHTGEKNILCPTCNKAFTRKDNMKQHERTHRNNASTSSAGGRRDSPADASEDTAASKDGVSSKRSKTNASAASVAEGSVAEASPTPSHVPMNKGPYESLPRVSDAELLAGGPSPSADGEMAYGAFGSMEGPKALRPGNERKISEGGQSMQSVDGEGESPGLDALAMAASGMS